MDRKKWMRGGSIGLVAVFLGACGGGGGSDDSGAVDTSPGGLYSYTTSSGAALLMVTENGSGWIYDNVSSPNRLFEVVIGPSSAVVSGDEVSYTGTIRQYDPSSGAEMYTGTVTASREPRTSATLTPFNLNYSLTGGGGSSSYSFSYQQQIYATFPASIGTIQGSYSATSSDSEGANHFISMTIGSSGALTATDSNGCTYSGTIAAVSSKYNGYQISGVTQTCGSATVSGLSGEALENPAVLSGSSAHSQQLYFTIWNSGTDSFETMTLGSASPT